jgi:hypothetical protein
MAAGTINSSFEIVLRNGNKNVETDPDYSWFQPRPTAD